ncbi:hypothetical protein CCHR01_17091 [Colletotrichum chrysophilum]|uniref:Uncharacterized protein n=1 Tax=Colletotrichum chrysophilum TaxID=1836956 RepID=A0AAD9A2L9_9PEZI|nr:hypothetical protein CCHR01_17091 [Colletotrichum chrysophilum]
MKDDEAYFSADDSDVGSVDLAELLDTLGRHLQYCDLSQTKYGRVIICDKFSRFLNGGFEFHQDSEGYSRVLVPTPHHSGDSCPNTEGCPDAPGQASYQDCEIDVRFKDCEYGDDLGIQPSEHVLLSITRAAIPPGILNKLFSILEPEATIDVQITGANAVGVKKLMEEVGFDAEILYEFLIPVGSRLAQELETGHICTQDDLTREDDRGVHEKILDWVAAGSVSLYVQSHFFIVGR